MAYARGKKLPLYITAAFLSLVFFNYLGLLNPLKYGLRLLFSPLFVEMNRLSVKIGDNYQFFSNRDEFFSAYALCQNNLSGKNIAEARLKILEEENYALKKQIDFRERAKTPLVMANVIGRNMGSAEKTIVINEGENAGIRVNQPVVVNGGILIGKIVKIEKDIAIARLINDNRSKIAATLFNRDRSLGVVEGGYGLSVRMSFIPRNENVAIGDQIITSGMEDGMPQGLVIGQVVAVENEAYQPFQQAVLSPAVDLSKLTIVGIMTGL